MALVNRESRQRGTRRFYDHFTRNSHVGFPGSRIAQIFNFMLLRMDFQRVFHPITKRKGRTQSQGLTNKLNMGGENREWNSSKRKNFDSLTLSFQPHASLQLKEVFLKKTSNPGLRGPPGYAVIYTGLDTGQFPEQRRCPPGTPRQRSPIEKALLHWLRWLTRWTGSRSRSHSKSPLYTWYAPSKWTGSRSRSASKPRCSPDSPQQRNLTEEPCSQWRYQPHHSPVSVLSALPTVSHA